MLLLRDLVVVETCLCMFRLVSRFQRINASCGEVVALIIGRMCFYVSSLIWMIGS